MLPFAIPAIQPVRLLSFPGKFPKDLAAVPTPIARAAMETLGKLARGEESAYGGVKRLISHHEILSTRIGADHRLLFRLRAEAIEAVALINRRDLDKTSSPSPSSPPTVPGVILSQTPGFLRSPLVTSQAEPCRETCQGEAELNQTASSASPPPGCPVSWIPEARS